MGRCIQAVGSADRRSIRRRSQWLAGQIGIVLARRPAVGGGGLRGALTISDLANRQQRRHAVYDRNHPIFANAFSPDGKRVLTVTSGGEAKWFDAVTGSQTGTVEGPLSTVLAVLPDGRIVSAAPRGLGSVEVRDASEGKVVARWLGHGTTINDIAVSRDGHCVSVAQDNSARLWNTSTGTSTVLWQNDAELVSVGFSTDGKNLVIAERSGLIRYWLGWSAIDVVENKPEIPTICCFSDSAGSGRRFIRRVRLANAVSTATAPYLSEIPALSASETNHSLRRSLWPASCAARIHASSGRRVGSHGIRHYGPAGDSFSWPGGTKRQHARKVEHVATNVPHRRGRQADLEVTAFAAAWFIPRVRRPNSGRQKNRAGQ